MNIIKCFIGWTLIASLENIVLMYEILNLK